LTLGLSQFLNEKRRISRFRENFESRSFRPSLLAETREIAFASQELHFRIGQDITDCQFSINAIFPLAWIADDKMKGLHRSEIQSLLACVGGRGPESRNVKCERQTIGNLAVFVEDEDSQLVLISSGCVMSALFSVEGGAVAYFRRG